MTDAHPMRLGCCYYPEHWPEAMWADDARRMTAMGLSRVRVGEFAWAAIEPEPGDFDWGWLDRAIETLGQAGLGVILGTPTATPPKWLVDRMPDMIAVDAAGRPRKFGSRRHYCFSHAGYRAEAARITRAFAERYGDNPYVVAWQTDNEYGCHDTVQSFSDAARDGFRRWLTDRYAGIGALNAAWHNIFWSMTYRSFDEIDLPNLTVTEANPSHWLDYRRFASDQVVAFNRAQTDILRALSPGRDIMHNYMGFFTEFDHHDVGADLDVAGWDSYPLGFLEQFWFSDADKLRYARQGHPDIAAFHHDLYRGCAQGRWWVIEQQPGPVNWARYNPAPLPGMVNLWTVEAMAHGAELVSYFRWRQFPGAQEQQHAGLLRPDCATDQGGLEARAAADLIDRIGAVGSTRADVALIFDYPSDWTTQIQPQGHGYRALRTAFEFYTAARENGLSVDIVRSPADAKDHAMVIAPCAMLVDDATADAYAALKGKLLLGPRAGSKTPALTIPDGLAPGPLADLIPLRVVRVESLRPGLTAPFAHGNPGEVRDWLEHVETALPAALSTVGGHGLFFRSGHVHYLAAKVDPDTLRSLIGDIARSAGLAPQRLPDGLRLRRTATHLFAFNYASEPVSLDALAVPDGAVQVEGSSPLSPAAYAIWTLPA